VMSCLFARHRNGGPDELRQRRRTLRREKRVRVVTLGSARGVTQKRWQREDSGSAEKVGNLGRGGRLERAKPTLPRLRLWRADVGPSLVAVEAPERIRPRMPAGGSGDSPREVKPKRVSCFWPDLTKKAKNNDARGEQGLGEARTGKRLASIKARCVVEHRLGRSTTQKAEAGRARKGTSGRQVCPRGQNAPRVSYGP
jgi:hypothetical protein